MNNKLYYIVITPLIIAGFIFPASMLYICTILVLVAGYFGWIEFKEKLKRAEGEQELQQAVVPVILLMLPVTLAIISLILYAVNGGS